MLSMTKNYLQFKSIGNLVGAQAYGPGENAATGRGTAAPIPNVG
jgi:hypothetical protein